eukprot:CAMPEP_0198145778 /NCGR_PEP_ID=MMETSP1443-20131203/25337_1 /TAXON_ID=186043 /ORGANISM="Entomoneis sp., Strain CCMP2396" /LENGTH=622 /DNA_ID=CAMNT_0043809503 /DNA_START=54 /DNA_END=1919 /DNA_ORIENTATION=-
MTVRASVRMERNSSVVDHQSARQDGLEWSKKRVKQAFRNSQIKDRMGELPQFDFEELVLGAVLGQGQFGDISEVRGFKIKESSSSTNTYRSGRSIRINYSPDGDDSSNNEDHSHPAADSHEDDARLFIADQCLRKGDARYAVKVLSSRVITDTKKFLQGIQDMAIESTILSDLEHPNIIKLRAVAKVNAYNEYFFTVLDKLYDSLEQRMKQWDLRMHRNYGCILPFGKKKADAFNKEIYKEKVVVMFDLADALRYTHSRSILYRDIKPENVGFDVRGDVRLFDFGFAKELREDSKKDDGTYHLTELSVTGPQLPRYMAPEIANRQNYNESSDCYSFAILCWQIMACQIPFEQHNLKTLQESVWNGKEERPEVNEKWPVPIKLMLKRSWEHDLHSRNNMQAISDILRAEAINAKNGEESSLDHQRRRSTFVFRPGQQDVRRNRRGSLNRSLHFVVEDNNEKTKKDNVNMSNGVGIPKNKRNVVNQAAVCEASIARINAQLKLSRPSYKIKDPIDRTTEEGSSNNGSPTRSRKHKVSHSSVASGFSEKRSKSQGRSKNSSSQSLHSSSSKKRSTEVHRRKSLSSLSSVVSASGDIRKSAGMEEASVIALSSVPSSPHRRIKSTI